MQYGRHAVRPGLPDRKARQGSATSARFDSSPRATAKEVSLPTTGMGTMFQGVTVSPAREYVGELWKSSGAKRAVMPCAGRFAAVVALRRAGCPPEAIETSDLCLFSSVVGVSCQCQGIEVLELTLSERIAAFVGTGDRLERAAGLLVGLKWASMKPTNLYVQSIRREVWANRDAYRGHIAGELAKLVDALGPIRYEVADVRDVVRGAAGDRDAFVYMDLPVYAGGYGKQFGEAEASMGWNGVDGREFLPKEVPGLMEELREGAALIASGVPDGAELPEGWHVGFAYGQGKGRVDRIVVNREPGTRYAEAVMPMKPPRGLPVYDEQEITAESVYAFLEVDAHTCLHFRDLFVHRLGTTGARRYMLGLIDGRVHTALGLDDQHLMLGNMPYMQEVFGITRTSARYDRLNKLFIACLLSGEFRAYIVQRSRALGFTEFTGIQTITLTEDYERQAKRGRMELVLREPAKQGGWRNVYRGQFSKSTYAEEVAAWLAQYGHHHRQGWVCEECGFGTPEGVKPGFGPERRERRGPVRRSRRKRG